jgi:DNA-binding winged helix-turn-helix (wHTH) protein
MKITTNGNELTIDGKTVLLRFKLIAMFNTLRKASPMVVTEAHLLSTLSIQSRNTLNQSISQLRKTLAVYNEIELVTHSKVGYQLKIKGGEQ